MREKTKEELEKENEGVSAPVLTEKKEEEATEEAPSEEEATEEAQPEDTLVTEH